MSGLTAEQVRDAIFNGSVYASYDGAQYYANGIDMQAIADTLNSQTERTCRIESTNGEWHCSCCGEVVGSDDPWCELFISENAIRLWDYCPNCGAKVVSE